MSSLLEEAYESFTVINKISAEDGLGGMTTVWTDGPVIKGTMIFDRSSQAKIAQTMGVTSVYTFTVKKNISLDYHTVVRRESDEKIFRITSNSDEEETPKGASLDMRQYSAEEWVLPNG